MTAPLILSWLELTESLILARMLSLVIVSPLRLLQVRRLSEMRTASNRVTLQPMRISRSV